MRPIHLVLGYAVVGGFALLWLWSLGAWVARRREVHARYWTLLGVLQVVLGLQVVAGVIVFALGGRMPFLHYLYGSLFPIVVLVGAHVVARNPENGFVPWKVFGFATFIAFGLTLRALTTGLGIG
ncbi:MAG: hypothetical protein WD770_04110 [Actinomycetota bacterium]